MEEHIFQRREETMKEEKEDEAEGEGVFPGDGQNGGRRSVGHGGTVESKCTEFDRLGCR